MNQSHDYFRLCGTGQNVLVFVESTSCFLKSVVGAPLPIIKVFFHHPAHFAHAWLAVGAIE
jgi:hypothetical protein